MLIVLLLLTFTYTVSFSQSVTQKHISSQEADKSFREKLQYVPFLIFPERSERPIRWLDSLRPE